MNEIIVIILDTLKMELDDEFDLNFERKGFFGNKWQAVKKEPNRGSLMNRSGELSSSIKSSRQGFRLVWQSKVPYAKIHNEGGTIDISAQKKVLHFNKKGKFNKNNKKAVYAQKASIGAHTVTMPQRQFIGTSPETDEIISKVIDEHLPPYIDEYINDTFNKQT